MKDNSSVIKLKYGSFKDIKRVFLANLPLFFIIVLLTFVTFTNSIKGEFVSDDLPGIIDNPIAHNFNEALKTAQLQTIIQSALYSIDGANPLPFHLFSMIMHITNVILFFLIIYDLFGKKVAAIASLLFTVHPLVTETVIWISAQNYQISTFLLFVSVLLYLLYKKNNSKLSLIIILVFLGLAPFTFGNFWILIIPFFLVGLDILIIDQKFKFSSLKIYVPIFAVAVLAFFLMGITQVGERVASLNTPEASPFLNRLPYSIYMTEELLIFPKDLSLYHEGEMMSKTKYKLMIVASIVTVITVLYMWKKEKYRTYAGLIILIFVSILPVFSPIQVAWFVADRYLYVGTGLFCVLLAMIIINLDEKRKIANLMIILTGILLTVYTVRSFIRTDDWKTRKKLWLATERVAPYSHRVHNNLGDVYGEERDWQRSIAHFQAAIKINPNYAEAMHNLGNTYMQMGDLESAKKILLISIEVNPALYQSMHKLGLVEYNLGNIDTAEDYFLKALEVNPSHVPSQQALQTVDALKTSQQKNQ